MAGGGGWLSVLLFAGDILLFLPWRSGTATCESCGVSVCFRLSDRVAADVLWREAFSFITRSLPSRDVTATLGAERVRDRVLAIADDGPEEWTKGVDSDGQWVARMASGWQIYRFCAFQVQ